MVQRVAKAVRDSVAGYGASTARCVQRPAGELQDFARDLTKISSLPCVLRSIRAGRNGHAAARFARVCGRPRVHAVLARIQTRDKRLMSCSFWLTCVVFTGVSEQAQSFMFAHARISVPSLLQRSMLQHPEQRSHHGVTYAASSARQCSTSLQ